jgi:hypothetical protein
MATLGTQNISTSYPQLLKVSGNTPFTSTLLAIATGDESSVSALQISTLGVSSSGTLNSVGATTLASSLAVTGAATFSSSLGVTGAATLSSSLGVTGVATFSTSINASSGTATIGTESVNTSTIGTLAVTNTATVGTLKVGASGPRLTAVSYGTAAFTLSTVQPHNLADTTTGTFALTGAALGDIVIGSIDSLGSTTGTVQIITSFFPIASNVIRYVVNSKGSTAGTVPAGTIFATAMRFTA